MQQALKITILGSGTSTGIPVIGCQCPVCRSSHPYNQRTRCSLLISSGPYNILIDTSTDLRQQALREDIRRVDAVFYTHGHADHLHGIDDLRAFNITRKTPIPIYASKETLEHINHSFGYIFEHKEHTTFIPKLRLNPMPERVKIGTIEMIAVPLQHGCGKSTGYRCGPVAYLTDCNAIPERSLDLLQGLDLLILDGLRYKPHQTHFNIPQAIEMAQRIGAKRTLLTHLSHDIEHLQVNAQLPQGIELAHDGQTLDFLLPCNQMEHAET